MSQCTCEVANKKSPPVRAVGGRGESSVCLLSLLWGIWENIGASPKFSKTPQKYYIFLCFWTNTATPSVIKWLFPKSHRAIGWFAIVCDMVYIKIITTTSAIIATIQCVARSAVSAYKMATTNSMGKVNFFIFFSSYFFYGSQWPATVIFSYMKESYSGG